MFCSQWFFVHMLTSLLKISFIFEKNEILMPHVTDWTLWGQKKGKVSTLLCFCLFVIFVFVLFSQKLIFQFQLARKSMFLWKKRSKKKNQKTNYFLIWTFVVSHSAPQKKFEKGCQLLTLSLLLTSSTLVTVLRSPTAIWRSTMIPPFRTNLSSSQRKTLPCRGLGPHY